VVMYLGKIVESARADALFAQPHHPYTKALFSAASRARPGQADNELVLGNDPPMPSDIPSGCRFRSRCPFAFDRCVSEEPQLRPIDAGQSVACHLY